MISMQIVETCPESAYRKDAGVSYGKVCHESYYSHAIGCQRDFNILLPANYDESKKYPVVYLLHGIFGDENVLLNDENNRLIEIFGNMAADGMAKEIILVLPDIYATADPEMKPSFSPDTVLPYNDFIKDLVQDLMPYVREHYAVYTDRENQGIAGFSMGGRQTLYIGLQRPDLFGYICAISPAPGLTPGQDWAMIHAGQMKEEEVRFQDQENLPNVLLICCCEQDGVVGKFPKTYHELFERNQIAHTWYEVPGDDHGPTAVRSGLYNFLRYAFQD